MRERYRWAASLLCSTLLLAACSGRAKPPEAATATTTATGLVEVRVLLHDSILSDAEIAAFQAKYANYRVVPVQSQGSYHDFIAAGQVDVMPAGVWDDLLMDNLLVDLGPYVQAGSFDLKPYGAGLDYFRADGKLVVLPVSIEPNVMIVNTDIFQQAGVPVPTDWTWDQLRETARKLTSGEGDAKVWGFASMEPENLVMEWLTQKTGDRAKITDDDLSQVLQFASTLARGDQSMPLTPLQDYAKSGATWIHMASPFEEGHAAIELTNLSALHNRPQHPYHWAVVPMPRFANAKPVAIANQVTTYGIAAASKNPKAAWEFLRFLAGPEGAVIAAKTGLIPMYQAPEVKTAWTDRPAAAPGSAFLLSTEWVPDPANHRRTYDPTTSRLYTLQLNAANQVMSGTASSEQALAEYKSRVSAGP